MHTYCCWRSMSVIALVSCSRLFVFKRFKTIIFEHALPLCLLLQSQYMSVYMVWYGTVWYGMVWYGMVWYGMAWAHEGGNMSIWVHKCMNTLVYYCYNTHITPTHTYADMWQQMHIHTYTLKYHSYTNTYTILYYIEIPVNDKQWSFYVASRLVWYVCMCDMQIRIIVTEDHRGS